MEHDPEIALRDVQALTNFRVGALFDFIQLKHLRYTGWEFAQGHLEVRSELLQLQPSRRGVGLCGDVMQPEHRLVPRFLITTHRRGVNAHRALATGMAQMIADFVAQDSDEPRPFGRLAGETLPGFESAEERVL